MMTKQNISPDLPPRFLQPEGWRWHIFTNPKGKKLRFGTVSPKGKIPDAVVVCLPGLSEFGEKYFELAHDMLDRNMAFWVLDWQGQGQSDRPAPNPHKRYVASFDDDIDDLHFFLKEYVRHAAVHPDVGRLPMVMIAHSMGANIGLRYLQKHPDMFACAAFTAPLVAIKATACLPRAFALGLAEMMRAFMGRSYVFGGKDWSPDSRENPGKNIFSSDPFRRTIHNAWCKADAKLQVGDVTFGWVHAALNSCAVLQRSGAAEDIQVPCLFALAEKDMLVDNTATRHFAARVKQAKIVEFPASFHEILMESDPIRSRFLNEFFLLMDENNIRDKLKTF